MPKSERAGAHEGFILWFTGLSGAGKSTIANFVFKELRNRDVPVELLDGDEVRTNLSKGLGFSRADRDTNIKRIGYVARLLSRNGVGVITAAISPYRETRQAVRQDTTNFMEVYVRCPLSVCIKRDVKGLYKKALAGEIQNFTGLDDPYEEPLDPELTLDTDHESPKESATTILAVLERRGLIPLRQYSANGLVHPGGEV